MNYLKFIPLAVLFVTFVATTAVSQYQISVLVVQVSDIQKTLSDVVVNQAVDRVKLENLK